MTRQQRIDAIAARLRVSSDLHIARVEAALGMTPRRDSQDPEMPWGALKTPRDATPDWTGLDALGRREGSR